VYRFRAPIVVAFFLFAMYNLAISLVHAEGINPDIYPLSSKPYGKTYGEWASEWWQWFSSIPKTMNPSIDQTGKDCNINQNDKNVWFLTLDFGTGKHITRSCSIPEGRAIFVPMFANDCDFSDASHPPISGLLKCARDFTDSLQRVSLTIDGKPIVSPQSYRVDSPLFYTTYAGPTNADNVYGVPPGKYPAQLNGYFIILHPLPIGEHNIFINTVAGGAPNTPTESAVAHDILYHLTVRSH
jgi:hypothetical protein